MTIEKIKEAMMNWRDFYGGDIPNTDEIQAATTKQELSDIIERYRSHLEDMALDASNHLDSFKKKVGLYMLP